MLKYAFKFLENGKPTLDWSAIKQDIIYQLNIKNIYDKIFNVVFTVLREPKTFSQLGYLHAEIIPKIMTGYRNEGYDIPSGKAGMDWTKFQIKTLPEIYFIKQKQNVITGEMRNVIRSFADASKEEMSAIIDICIRLYGEYFGITFESPDEYKKRMKLKDEKEDEIHLQEG